MKIKMILLVVMAVIFCGSFVTAQLDRVEQLEETEKMAWFWTKKDQEKEAKRKEKAEKKKAIKDKKKAAKKRKKEERLQIKQAKVEEKKIKKERKRIRKERDRSEKKAREAEKPKKRSLTNQEIDMYVDQWKSDLADYQREERSTRNALIENWKDARKIIVSKQYSDGKYADLYNLPSWPLEALFADHKSLINLRSKFTYQTSAYGSNGSKGDLSNLIFSEDQIRLQDILLSLKLANEGRVDAATLSFYEGVLAAEEGLNYSEKYWFKDFDQIKLIAESNEFRKDLNYSRYVVGRQILVGFDIPIVYKRHYLKTSFHEYFDKENFNVENFALKELNFKTAFEKVLALKDLSYNRKNSVTGIGDINLFANCNIRSRFFEKANWGFKLQLPTSKNADVTKLWAPSLGEEFVKFSAHLAMLWGPRDWFNPHFLIQATYAASANVDRRIPKRIKRGDVVDGDLFEGKMLLGDYVQAIADQTFSEWDTTVKEMADESRKVSLQPGPEFFVRIGNVFEKVLLRRMFLDLFCDFRAKFEDSASGLPEDDYDLRLIEQNTNEIEGLFGINFSYQFDYNTRLQFGGRYTFVGLNVPQTMELNCNLGIEF